MSTRDPGVLALGVLWILAPLPACLLGLLLIPTGYAIGHEPPFDQLSWGPGLGVLIGLGEGIWVGGTGALGVLAGVGLLARRRWAWGLAVVMAVVSLVTCCLPLGLCTLWGLTRPAARRDFGVA